VIIRHNGENIQVGTFATFPEALEARNNKLRELMLRIPFNPSQRLATKTALNDCVATLRAVAKTLKYTDDTIYNVVTKDINKLAKLVDNF
jgi:hypothetical protein